MEMPTTSYPFSLSRAAVTEESTPPLMATTARCFFTDMNSQTPGDKLIRLLAVEGRIARIASWGGKCHPFIHDTRSLPGAQAFHDPREHGEDPVDIRSGAVPPQRESDRPPGIGRLDPHGSKNRRSLE